MTYRELLDRAQHEGGLSVEDLHASLVGLFNQVAELHAIGLVAPLRGTETLLVDDRLRVSVDITRAGPPLRNRARIREIQNPENDALDIVGRSRADTDVDSGIGSLTTVDVVNGNQPIVRPVFVVGHQTWEHCVGHHDELSDVASLGAILAELALGIDFNNRDDVEEFAQHRRNLFARWPVHPVVAQLIGEMTDPDRTRRAQDVASLAQRLDAYRDQPADFDLANVDGALVGPLRTRRTAIQAALRDRLFEINRRNRLVYFQPSAQSVNMTVGSMPLLLDVRNVRAEDIATWNQTFAAKMLSGRPLKLNGLLRFDEASYLPGVLDKLISQARRDRAEYGMAQLRLVVCFLHWHNLKENRAERITSPLLLLPVSLTKRKGVKDSYELVADTTVAEVNPALRQHLRQLYAIELPETWDLNEQPIDVLREHIERQARSTEAVTVRLLERPQIELIRRRAQLRVDQYRKRQRSAAAKLAPARFPYSYERSNYQPLGIQLFDALVRYQRPESLRLSAGVPTVRQPSFGPQSQTQQGTTVRVVEQDAYALREDTPANPYDWTVDLCSLTLANFNYRKMTLVRDYSQLIESDQPSDAFDRLFSLDARPLDDDVDTVLPIEDQHLIIAADETQRAALARARAGRSFIIQGPPGTGKSQTITNLIADYVARGKRVLFVCEKRAAIDVVHARLRKQGLDELCAVIHDSQADKRIFIQALRATYEAWLGGVGHGSTEADRTARLAELRSGLAGLERLEASLRSIPAHETVTARELLERAVALPSAVGGSIDPSTVPPYGAFVAHRQAMLRVVEVLGRSGVDASFARHPLAAVDARHYRVDSAGGVPELLSLARETKASVSALCSDFAALNIDPQTVKINELVSLRRLVELAETLPDANASLLRPGPTADEFRRRVTEIASLQAKAAAAHDAAQHWTTPLDPVDTTAALDVARSKEESALKFLSGAWRSVKKTVSERYNFAQHSVRPSVQSVLELLAARHEADHALRAALDDAAAVCGSHDPKLLNEELRELHLADGPIGLLRDKLANSSTARVDAARVRSHLDLAIAHTGSLLDESANLRSVQAVADLAGALVEHPGSLAELCRLLTDTEGAPVQVLRYWRVTDTSFEALERHVLDHSLNQWLAANADVARFDLVEAERSTQQLRDVHPAALESNAAVVRQRTRDRFVARVAVSNLSAAQLNADQKELKKRYAAGRRELEHEFGKTMRFKSIRDLVAGPSGPVVMDLRPIWLMSPLSVSDTLPLDPDSFDVVIFDEASQIPIEDAIPALYRSHQMVVVGDQMQLPPTQFFSSNTDDDSLEVEDDDGQRVAIVLDGDSFLAQSASSLPSTMLQWHYRSRSEDLIGFSNAAFYGGALATVPDRDRTQNGRDDIVVGNEAPMELSSARGVDALLSRRISFHRLEHGVYENRRNEPEAVYIAEMVRALLMRRTGFTIGIAAFSEAQQSEIETSLERLAEQDRSFAVLLEEEMQREDDGQFVGLFVKNLENIQGDERDVIIMSVCYGPSPTGRMLMNFGPINQSGGEKRLNVIFSRAKQHMAIVSTIRSTQITNEHNDGANALRRFLSFAEALSAGREAEATSVLTEVNPAARRSSERLGSSPVIDGVAEALRFRGLHVERNVGRSHFRCDLAVRREGPGDHQVAVLIDAAAQTSPEELVLSRIGILEAFGWSVVSVNAKDWYLAPQQVIDAIERRLPPS
jgi:superfamily I DNA and/or RNA helicase